MSNVSTSIALRKENGVTLIELLVVMAITSILIGSVFAGYRTFDNRQRVKQAALTLKNNLRQAQTKAIAVDIPSGCANLNSMNVEFVSDTTYNIIYDCDDPDTPGTEPNIKYLNQDFVLPNGIEFTSYPDVVFTLLTGQPVSGATFTLASGSVSFSVELTDSGVINCTGDDDGTPIKCI